MEEGLLGAVIAAVITSLALALLNVFLQRDGQKHAAKLQQDQWNQEAEWRREDARNARGLQVHAQDAARTDQRNEWAQRRVERQEQFDKESLVGIQDAITRLSDASRWIYLDRIGRYHFEQRVDRGPEERYESAPTTPEHTLEFNRLRFSILPVISRVRNEKVRTAALDLYYLDLDMVLLRPSTWVDSEIYGNDEPVEIQERRLPHFIRIAGMLLREESIEDEIVPRITRADGDGYRGDVDWDG